MQEITAKTFAELDLIVVIGLINALGADLDAPKLNGKYMVRAEICGKDRLPTHPDYSVDPVFYWIKVSVCGGLPLRGTRAYHKATAAVKAISQAVETRVVFAS